MRKLQRFTARAGWALLLSAVLGHASSFAADVTVTQLTPFQWFTGEYTTDESGVSHGWNGGRNPTSPPLYTVDPSTQVAKLIGGMRAYKSTSLNWSLRDTALSSVGLYSKDPSVGLYERIELDSSSQLYGRILGTPVRNSAGYVYGVMTGTDSVTALYRGSIVGNGLVFRADPDGTHLESVASTVGQLSEPNGALVATSDDAVYGIDKGPKGNGRIFRIGSDGSLGTLYEFGTGPTGQRQVANGLVLGADGWLYGVTGYVRGLPFKSGTPTATDTPTGTLYRIDPVDASTFQVLHTFTLGEGEINVRSNAGLPYGFSGLGTVTYAEQDPIENSNAGTDAQDLSWLVDGGDGWLYGNLSIATCMIYSEGYSTTSQAVYTPLCGHLHLPAQLYGEHAYPYYDGPNPYGVIYRMRTDGSGKIQLLHVFNDSDGATPRGRLTVGKDGNIYGTTVAGGANKHWVIHDEQLRESGLGNNSGSISAQQQQTCDDRFSGTDSTSVGLHAKCVADPSAYLYQSVGEGTLFRIVTSQIQASEDGTVSNGGFESLHSFSADVDGFRPLGVQAGSDGYLYGATVLGGHDDFQGTATGRVGYGALFQVDIDGGTPNGSVSLAMTPSQIDAGQQAVLNWTTNQATNCVATSTANDWTGAQATTGSVILTPAMGTYRYTLSCTDSVKGGTISASTALYVGTNAEVNDGITQSHGNGGAFGLALLPVIGGLAWARRRRAGKR